MHLSLAKQVLIVFIPGIIFGMIIVLALRFVLIPEQPVIHHHSNFAVFLLGKRIDFSAEKYMEDVAACRPDGIPLQPKERVHMHNNVGDLAHIHDDGVTWGHFFGNLGWVFGKNFVIADDGRAYFNSGKNTVKYILNGKSIENPLNALIGSEDRLLISFGSEKFWVAEKEQFPLVPETAHEKNLLPDPGSCSGVENAGFLWRLQRTFLD